MTLNAQIFYMNFASEKHEGRSHLSSHIFPFQNSVNMYPNWITKSPLDPMALVTLTKIVTALHNRLTYIFNLSIEKNHYPSEFKKAKVIPLPKTRDKTNLTDYRPISLLSVLSILLEKHVHVQLNDYLEKHLLIHPSSLVFNVNTLAVPH